MMHSLWVALISAIIFLYITPSPIEDAQPYDLGPLPKLEGVFAKNELLGSIEKLYEGMIVGPESFDFDSQGRMYFGCANGTIFRSSREPGSPLEVFVLATGSISPSVVCDGSYHSEPICGRPLGMRFRNGTLWVLDAYHGLQSYDAQGQLTSHLDAFQGRKLGFPNDLDFVDGKIFFTESSPKFQRKDYMLLLMEHANSGNLFSYDIESRDFQLEKSGFCWPNGIQHVQDENGNFVFVAETSAAQIKKIHVTGSQAGQVEISAKNLPCLPDNVRWDKQHGVLWVGCSTKRSLPFSLVDAIGPYPGFRKFMTKIIPQSWILKLAPIRGMILALDKNGHVIKTLQDESGNFGFFSEVKFHENFLYLGSFRNSYLGRLKLPPNFFNEK
eukprot:TRINITY_DN2654_c0_g2_i1.p1 TRINITY_DN2654_c0_g2~~TRINITY_DN2654_c0_g2_i1.p1  ORF type:complete len:385 (-),score=97.74 TRINITY_DN2654_c0_g2_i1:8-1162(-)